MTTTDKIRTITLTDRAPVQIDEAVWPRIAYATRHDGEVECQANHKWHLTVRQHADGRRIVYGSNVAGPGGGPAGWEESRGGELVAARDDLERAWREQLVANNVDTSDMPPLPLEGGPLGNHPDDEATVAAIRRVGERARCSVAMIDEVIAELPATELV